ncbi:MAG TPA: universal stress protein [Chthoniobacterales bacterium]|nr:universal stress protein [Chthoniobacterales bacterium]
MKTATLPMTRRFPRISCRIRPRTTKINNLKIKNVLAPVDFSERSIETLELAAGIAKQFGANLHIAHVYERDMPVTTVMAMPLALPPVEVAPGVRRHLKDVAKRTGIELRPAFIHAEEGRPFEEICHLARQRKIDLIVVATRGNTGLKHLLLGSTAERIVRYSPCPVLVVYPRLKTEKRGLRFERILVPIDFSDCSLTGLEYAKQLAQRFESKLVLLNSVAFQYYITNDEYARYDLPLLLQQAEKASRRQMRELIQETDWDGIEVEPSLQIGHAGQQICARAAEDDADLIVTSTHGTTGFKHILVGSTAEYVVRHATCPVLVVPSHERPEIKSGKTGKR